MSDSSRAPAGSGQAVFVSGSTMRHILVMTATGSIGLMAIFVVDFLSLLYISWLGDTVLTAAVGLATAVLFITTSVNIGFMIAAGALVARALGAGDRPLARRLAAAVVAFTVVAATLLSLAALPFLSTILNWLGATGDVHARALRFLWIVMPTNALMALGMSFSGVLRAAGDARRAMHVTLSAAIVAAVLDPILIFGFRLGLDGAALVYIASRVALAIVGYLGAVRLHVLIELQTWSGVAASSGAIFAIAGPAVLTNLASPLALAFLAAVLARFGESAIAANTIIDRLVPMAFGIVFALSGSVGPVLGQNWGARRFDRLRQALVDALRLMAGYILAVWLLLVVFRKSIPPLFGVTGEIADLVIYFCLISGPTWLFLGALFVGNAAFNNLGFPLYATAFNWGRATLGTMPLTLIGAKWAGPVGAQIGLTIGAAVFGIWAAMTAFHCIGILESRAKASG